MNEQEMQQAPAWAKELFDRMEALENQLESQDQELAEIKRDVREELALVRKLNKVRTRGEREYCLDQENTDPRVVQACEEAREKKEGISRKRIEQIFDVEKTRANQILESIVEHNADFKRHTPQSNNEPSRLVADDPSPGDGEPFSGLR